jgi:predicted SprT family Zn-dependent metalloprotease
MVTIQLKVIPESEVRGRAVLTRSDGDNAIVSGKGDYTYTCGKCQKVLLENIVENQLQNMILKCGSCGEYNNLP